MRVLGTDVINELVLDDHLSGGTIKLYFRSPTTKESTGYSNGMVVRRGNKMERNLGQVRQQYGAKILTGVGDGSFGKMVDGKPAPISSDPTSPNYDPNWKQLVAAQAPDVIEILAVHVFEVSVSKAPTDDGDGQAAGDEPEDDAEGK